MHRTKGDIKMKISKELSTGTIPMMVLSVLKSEDMYGYKIIKTLELRSDNVFSLKEGTLYPILHSMEKENVLESYWDVSTGRKKKYQLQLNSRNGDRYKGQSKSYAMTRLWRRASKQRKENVR